jgi:hypothetical protein
VNLVTPSLNPYPTRHILRRSRRNYTFAFDFTMPELKRPAGEMNGAEPNEGPDPKKLQTDVDQAERETAADSSSEVASQPASSEAASSRESSFEPSTVDTTLEAEGGATLEATASSAVETADEPTAKSAVEIPACLQKDGLNEESLLVFDFEQFIESEPSPDEFYDSATPELDAPPFVRTKKYVFNIHKFTTKCVFKD